jgi:glycosyltransferase involved in cell wall biosynthesis
MARLCCSPRQKLAGIVYCLLRQYPSYTDSDMRILIISPKYPPANGADSHRVRMLVPHLVALGVHVEVLCIDPNHTECPEDPWLAGGMPPEVMVHPVLPLAGLWRKIPGLGGLGFRSLNALRRGGDNVLKARNFDLIFFSSTVFEIQVLGPYWQRKFGVPFVLDYQDPWVNDYYREHPDIIPPGGRIKYAGMDIIHRWMEPRVLRHCAGIISVSPAYPQQIATRYPWLPAMPTLLQPFPGDERDLLRVREEGITQNYFNPSDGKIHWVYAGVIHHAMKPTLRALFTALRKHGKPELMDNLQMHFIGTNYSSGRRAVAQVVPVAEEFGLDAIVREYPERIAMSTVLKCLQDASALMVLGTNDPGYTASKIYPYLLTGKPLLVGFHKSSSIHTLLAKVGGAVPLTFCDTTSVEELADLMYEFWIAKMQYAIPLKLNVHAFNPYTAKAQAKELLSFLEATIESWHANSARPS